MRIISIAPDATEILFELGLERQLVAVTEFCNYPPEAKAIKKIGDFSNPNIERILQLKPDLIIASGLEQEPFVRTLKSLKLNVLQVFPSGIDELFKSILEIGKATDREKKAEDLVGKLKKELDAVKFDIKTRNLNNRKKVYIEIWNDPLTTAGQETFVNDLIEAGGGENIAKGFVKGYGRISPEIIIKENPDCIILGYMQNTQARHNIEKRAGWNEIKAVKSGNICDTINPDLLFRPGPRSGRAVRLIYERLYEK